MNNEGLQVVVAGSADSDTSDHIDSSDRNVDWNGDWDDAYRFHGLVGNQIRRLSDAQEAQGCDGEGGD